MMYERLDAPLVIRPLVLMSHSVLIWPEKDAAETNHNLVDDAAKSAIPQVSHVMLGVLHCISSPAPEHAH